MDLYLSVLISLSRSKFRPLLRLVTICYNEPNLFHLHSFCSSRAFEADGVQMDVRLKGVTAEHCTGANGVNVMLTTIYRPRTHPKLHDQEYIMCDKNTLMQCAKQVTNMVTK